GLGIQAEGRDGRDHVVERAGAGLAALQGLARQRADSVLGGGQGPVGRGGQVRGRGLERLHGRGGHSGALDLRVGLLLVHDGGPGPPPTNRVVSENAASASLSVGRVGAAAPGSIAPPMLKSPAVLPEPVFPSEATRTRSTPFRAGISCGARALRSSSAASTWP